MIRRHRKMHKCYSCGQPFDGNVCPVCGKKFQNEDIGANTKFKSAKKLYSVFHYLPSLLLLFFAILVLALSLLPVAINTSGEIAGEAVAVKSYGNIYKLGFGTVNELEKLKPVCISLAVIAVLTLIYSIIAGDIRAITPINNKKAGNVKLGDLLTFAGNVFYLPIFIIGCVICGIIIELDGGAGIVAVGAYPVLLIVLSALFAISSICILIIRKRLLIKYPSLKDLNP